MIRHTRFWVIAALLLAGGTLAAQVFRGGTDLVLLNVTVTANNQFVGSLERSDFTVLEDGMPQEILNFTHTPQPIALSILLDASASMEHKLPIAQEAAVGLIDRLNPHDVAQIVSFDSLPNVVQDFTNDRAALETAIRKTRVGNSTALYNAIDVALNDLRVMRAESQDQIRRQAIVVLSDGEDTSSLLPFEEVLDLAKRSETAIYAIGLRAPEGPGTTTKGFKEAEFVLRQFAQETGARSSVAISV